MSNYTIQIISDILDKMDSYYMHNCRYLRRGQAYINYLFYHHRDIHDMVDQTDSDCFYSDEKINNLITFMYLLAVDTKNDNV